VSHTSHMLWLGGTRELGKGAGGGRCHLADIRASSQVYRRLGDGTHRTAFEACASQA
jgi:hypothetical protein